MSCAELLTTQAYLDGELDAATSLRAERHLLACTECARLRESISAIREAMRETVTYYSAPEHLTAELLRAAGSTAESRSSFVSRLRSWWSEKAQFIAGAGAGFATAAAAACLALLMFGGPAQQELATDVVSAHIRSLIGTHLIDVASNDHHTVKPWFSGRSDVSPPVADFTEDGFHLIGGRMDYVDGRRAAVTVYRHGAHIVNVFAWKDLGDVTPGARVRNGYQMISWREGGLFYCAVSDTNRHELVRLSELIEETARARE